MNKKIEDMTNKELVEYCEVNKIDVDSKNVSKPTKTELLQAIENIIPTEDEIDSEGLYDEQDFDLDAFLSQPDKVEQEEVPTRVKKVNRQALRKAQIRLLMPRKRVIITINDNNQTTIPTQVHFTTWGNRLIGYYTDKFVTGKPWHVREGGLRNLRGMMAAVSIQDEEGNTIKHESVPKYIIQDLTPLTEKEINVIGKRQIIRDSAVDSLI